MGLEASKQQEECYDYILSGRPTEHEGAPQHIMKRGDHRAITMNIKSSEGYVIKFKGRRRDPMHSWSLTPQAVARLARRRA